MRQNAPYPYEKNQNFLRRARETPAPIPRCLQLVIGNKNRQATVVMIYQTLLIVENQKLLNFVRMKYDVMGFDFCIQNALKLTYAHL
jgi:hypothetical protein